MYNMTSLRSLRDWENNSTCNFGLCICYFPSFGPHTNINLNSIRALSKPSLHVIIHLPELSNCRLHNISKLQWVVYLERPRQKKDPIKGNMTLEEPNLQQTQRLDCTQHPCYSPILLIQTQAATTSHNFWSLVQQFKPKRVNLSNTGPKYLLPLIPPKPLEVVSPIPSQLQR
jgi:hypothetical protein